MLSPLASVISVEKSDISFMIVPWNFMCPSPTPLTASPPPNVAVFKMLVFKVSLSMMCLNTVSSVFGSVQALMSYYLFF